jgi:hypothetical protein
MKITNIQDARLFVTVRFPDLDKLDSLDAIADQLQGTDWRMRPCMVQAVVSVDKAEWAKFAHDLQAPRPWLAEFGGSECLDPRIPEGVPFGKMTDEQEAIYRRHGYTLVVAISCHERPTIYINSGGYEYARHAGII